MSTIQINVLRSYFNDCTYSRIRTDSGFHCFGLELPWRGNENDISCIPEGKYDGYIRYSPNQKRDVITLRDVPDRTWINIEVGNYTRNILGCLIVGDGIRDIDNDGTPDVTNSGATHDRLMAEVRKFDKIIVNIQVAGLIGHGVYL